MAKLVPHLCARESTGTPPAIPRTSTDAWRVRFVMMNIASTVDRESQTARLLLDGDLAIANAKATLDWLKAAVRRRNVRFLVLDFQRVRRIDGAGIAVVSLGRTLAANAGKQLELTNVDRRHRRALELVPPPTTAASDVIAAPVGQLERVGNAVLDLGVAFHDAARLFGDVWQQLGHVLTRRKKLPRGVTSELAVTMGVEAVPIIGLLAALLGATLAFQGVILLERFGAGIYVADMCGLSMVREFGPMMTAIVLCGRNGAAIAAELGTMRVRGELDALDAMGISSTRFLVLPRLLAIIFVQPALTLMAMFTGIIAAMVVGNLALDLPMWVFWSRIVERVELIDFVHGLGKSFVFAWIIGLTGVYLGMRTTPDPSSVGRATTRTVVVGIFLIILTDAIAATLGTLGGTT